ncbi:restriction endonuclease [Streptomyces albovinaceus]|uniref:restriction endonuclease n=1 Tax=Streptomyces albovinaceus TaxID=66867 RepID=UPI000A3C24F2|nr:restriction endonuclease [Streptomyces albovinaceus]
MSVLDFAELPKDGEGFELLVRDIAMMLGYKTKWSGRGPDGGRDLLLEEPGSAHLGEKARNWLVSCKHTAHAHAGKGRSVGLEDLGADGGIADAVAQHQAQAFLLACSTQPSSAVVTRLEAIERNRGIPTHIWDGVDLERALDSAKGWSVAQRFLPKSAGGWRIISADKTNEFVGITRGYYIRFVNRVGSRLYTHVMDECLDLIELLPLPVGAELRPRCVFYDDVHTRIYWQLDYLHEPRDAVSPTFMRILQDQLVATFDHSENMGGVDIAFRITARRADRGGDWYDPDNYEYYKGIDLYDRF